METTVDELAGRIVEKDLTIGRLEAQVAALSGELQRVNALGEELGVDLAAPADPKSDAPVGNRAQRRAAGRAKPGKPKPRRRPAAK